jgi:general secretion pathway protein E
MSLLRQLESLESVEALAALRPAFKRALTREFDLASLAGRLCPALFDDGSVAIFLLADFAHADQVDEVERMVLQRGYALSEPGRYAVSAPLLLAVAREQINAVTLRSRCVQPIDSAPSALLALFHDLVRWGVERSASDIHLNVMLSRSESEVRYTVDGLYLAPEAFRRMPTRTLMEILAVAWMRVRGGNGAVFDPLSEQQGRLKVSLDDRQIALRWASLATDAGPSVCLRILRTEEHGPAIDLASLGYLPSQIEALERARTAEGGAIVLAGVVGSGKSTTIATLMSGILETRKVITLEDPVEYAIPGALQNTVGRCLDEAASPVFDAKLKTLKRSAMNDLLIGEVRDAETGRAFSDLAASGVSLYTTTHTGAAMMIPERLASDFIGISRDLLATPGVLKLLVYQTLLPQLCMHCALPLEALLQGAPAADGSWRASAWWRQWRDRLLTLYAFDPSRIRVRNPNGCPQCIEPGLPASFGLNGRTVAAEILDPTLDDTFLRCVRNGDNVALRTHIRRQATSSPDDVNMDGKSALACAMYKVSIGMIDPRSIESSFSPFVTLQRHAESFARETFDA